MSYPDMDSTDYPDGTNECDRPDYDAYVEESLANWNGMYDSMLASCFNDVPFDDPADEDWWPPHDDHELLGVA